MAANGSGFRMVALCTILALIGIDVARPENVQDTPQPYYPRNYTQFDYIINHPDLCQGPNNSSGKQQPLLLMIMVFSAVPHASSRQAIRQTWGTVSSRTDVQLAFLLGATNDTQEQKRVADEDALYGDLLQGDFQDVYRNLTLKSIMMLKWVNTSCQPLPRFVLKIDDDCFLNPPHALQFLQKTLDEGKGDAIYGYTFRGHQKPHRDKKNKWVMPKYEYPPKYYPEFTSGPSYFWTGGAVPRLYDAVLHTPLISLEDVYINGLCAQYANVPNVYVDSMSLNVEPKACKINRHITFHDIHPEKFYLLWWIINDSRFDSHCSKGQLPDRLANSVLSDVIKNDVS